MILKLMILTSDSLSHRVRSLKIRKFRILAPSEMHTKGCLVWLDCIGCPPTRTNS